MTGSFGSSATCGDSNGGPSPLFDEFFALQEGALVRVRYPFRMLLVFDRASRDRAFREYLAALWVRGLAGEPLKLEHDRALRRMRMCARHSADMRSRCTLTLGVTRL